MADLNREPQPVDPAVDPADPAFENPDEQFVDLGGLNVLPEEVPVELEGDQLIDLNSGEVVGIDAEGFTQTGTGLNILPEDVPNQEIEGQELSSLNTSPTAVNPASDSVAQVLESAGAGGSSFQGALFNTNSSEAAIAQSLAQQARLQQTISAQRRQVNNGDWRVKLRLAPQAKYLYNAPNPGILQPLAVTDGVVFPYTPIIDTAYKADYDSYTLTHSNYKGYFYKGSYADQVNLRCTFTAQDTSEANYLLAVITFFKSVTKMFYGQDAERGAPPPLVYLSGLGQYQFNEHPCVVNQFNFNLPGDVDYIRAGSPNSVSVDQLNQRSRQSVSTFSNFGSVNRLAAALLSKGALPNRPAPASLQIASPTYVPTKMEISITLLPVQSRQQVSKQFSVKDFANGNLIKGGFW